VQQAQGRVSSGLETGPTVVRDPDMESEADSVGNLANPPILRLPKPVAAALGCRFPVADSQVIEGVLTDNEDDDDFKIDSYDEREDEKTEQRGDRSVKLPRVSARDEFWPSGFVKTKRLDTRKDLMSRQKLRVHSLGRSASMTSPLNGTRMKMKIHKGNWVEDVSLTMTLISP